VQVLGIPGWPAKTGVVAGDEAGQPREMPHNVGFMVSRQGANGRPPEKGVSVVADQKVSVSE
jgi:hypothetical protein